MYAHLKIYLLKKYRFALSLQEELFLWQIRNNAHIATIIGLKADVTKCNPTLRICFIQIINTGASWKNYINLRMCQEGLFVHLLTLLVESRGGWSVQGMTKAIHHFVGKRFALNLNHKVTSIRKKEIKQAVSHWQNTA